MPRTTDINLEPLEAQRAHAKALIAANGGDLMAAYQVADVYGRYDECTLLVKVKLGKLSLDDAGQAEAA